MCHLETSSLITTFHVESFIRFRAVKDCLVASNFLCDVIQCFYDMKAKVFSLLVFCDGNVLDVTDEPEIMDAVGVQLRGAVVQVKGRVYVQFPLHNNSTSPYDLALPVAHYKYMVLILLFSHPVKAPVPCFFCNITDIRQYAQHIEDASMVVGALERPDGVLKRKSGCDFRGDEGGREERGGGG